MHWPDFAVHTVASAGPCQLRESVHGHDESQVQTRVYDVQKSKLCLKFLAMTISCCALHDFLFRPILQFWRIPARTKWFWTKFGHFIENKQLKLNVILITYAGRDRRENAWSALTRPDPFCTVSTHIPSEDHFSSPQISPQLTHIRAVSIVAVGGRTVALLDVRWVGDLTGI